LSNAIETFAVRSRDEGYMSMDIRCLFPELGPVVGYAATATIRALGRPEHADQTALYLHVREVPAPRVVVVQDLDEPPGCGSLWGEVNATIFGALGCAGCVTDGCVRDLKEARAMGFHFFARGPGVSHAYVRVESAGEPVTVGGLRVSPGDLIHATSTVCCWSHARSPPSCRRPPSGSLPLNKACCAGCALRTSTPTS